MPVFDGLGGRVSRGSGRGRGKGKGEGKRGRGKGEGEGEGGGGEGEGEESAKMCGWEEVRDMPAYTIRTCVCLLQCIEG